MLLPSLRWKYTCLASDLCGNVILILHGSNLDIHSNTATGIGGRQKLHSI